MIRIGAHLRKERFDSRMILQVHDELLFEAPPGEQEALESLVRKEMEQVHKLAVPLLVEMGSGPNWRDME
jgi:DNA polymerase I